MITDEKTIVELSNLAQKEDKDLYIYIVTQKIC